MNKVHIISKEMDIKPCSIPVKSKENIKRGIYLMNGKAKRNVIVCTNIIALIAFMGLAIINLTIKDNLTFIH